MALSPADQGTEAHRIAERELRIQQSNTAFERGVAHVAAVLKEFGPESSNWPQARLADGGITRKEAERLLEMAFSRASEFDNPYVMVAYGDEGHERPAWSRGFNKALAEHYGVKLIDRDDIDEDYSGALNGYMPTTAHCSRRITNMIEAEEAARKLSEITGVMFWPEDRGSYVSPRYAVIRGFQIGEPVSYGFNADSYPAGRIVSMTGAGTAEIGFRIITTRDHKGVERKFWRRGQSGSWKQDGMWSLMHGWHRDRNWSL